MRAPIYKRIALKSARKPKDTKGWRALLVEREENPEFFYTKQWVGTWP